MGLKKEASNGKGSQRDGRILAVNLMHLAAAIGAIGAGLQIDDGAQAGLVQHLRQRWWAAGH